MTPFESLRLYGTIFVSQQTIRQAIGFGEPIMQGMEFKGFDGRGPALNLNFLAMFLPRDFKPILKDLVPIAQKKFAMKRRLGDRLLDEISVWLEENLTARISGRTLDTSATERDRQAFAGNPMGAATMLWEMMKAGENAKTIDIEVIADDDDDEEFDDPDAEIVDLSLVDSMNVVLIALTFGKDYDQFVEHMNDHEGNVEDMMNCMLSKIHEYGKFKDSLGINVADAICLLGVRLMRARMKTTDQACSASEMNYGKRFAVEVLERALNEAKQFKKER